VLDHSTNVFQMVNIPFPNQSESLCQKTECKRQGIRKSCIQR